MVRVKQFFVYLYQIVLPFVKVIIITPYIVLSCNFEYIKYRLEITTIKNLQIIRVIMELCSNPEFYIIFLSLCLNQT